MTGGEVEAICNSNATQRDYNQGYRSGTSYVRLVKSIILLGSKARESVSFWDCLEKLTEIMIAERILKNMVITGAMEKHVL